MLHTRQLYLEATDVDRFGRTMGVIYTANGDEVSIEIVYNGNAWWYERYAEKAIDYKHCQESTQRNKCGLRAE